MDRNYWVSMLGGTINIVNIFADRAQKVSFEGASTGMAVDIEVVEESREIVVLDRDANLPNQVYVVDEAYDFGGGVLDVPEDSTLEFHGGCILNARIKYNNTLVTGDGDIVNCECEGKLANAEVRPEMYGARTLNFTDNSYDISAPIQNALDSGNFSFVIDNSEGRLYYWNTAVNLYDTNAQPNERKAWNVCIRGEINTPVLGEGSHYTNYTVLIKSTVAFYCYEVPGSGSTFSFHGTAWPCVYLSNLNFRFQNDLSGGVFFEGVITRSKIDGVAVCNCQYFFRGGITVTTLIANCFVEVWECVFGGYMVDSKVENCHFVGLRKKLEKEPVFYMNSVMCGTSSQMGSLTATVISNNFINYFYTVFVMGHTWDDCILTHGNIFNVFKYFAWCKYWVAGVIVDKSASRGTVIISNGDTFRNCNNFPTSHVKSTDKFLLDQTVASIKDNVAVRDSFIDEGGVEKYEIYSILGKVIHNSSFQINSFIDETNSFVFARDKARKVGTTGNFNAEDYTFGAEHSLAFQGDMEVHSGEFICGGRPSMYPFKFMSASTSSMSQGVRYRRPALHDLQDMTVGILPDTQLFNGRRVIYNNEICTYRQPNPQSYVGQWVNPQGIVRKAVQ